VAGALHRTAPYPLMRPSGAGDIAVSDQKLKVEVKDRIKAPAEAVWALVRDFGGVTKWNPPSAIEGCSVEGDGIGAVRTLTLPGGAALQERLEAFDEGAMSMSYSFTGKLLLPLEDYYATMRVSPAGEGECDLEWSSSFGPGPMPEADAKSTVEGIYTGGIQALRSATES
jgi:hypothetical protein